MEINHKIAFGGGCHWCTEAIYQSLKGVRLVEQGFVASKGEESSFSEAVIVHFDPRYIDLEDLILIHLYTHKSTSDHSMRKKYRSAIYTFNLLDTERAIVALQYHQAHFKKPLVTKVLPFGDFKISDKAFRNYYFNDPEKPFCETFIAPKLRLLLLKFGKHVDENKVLGQ
ncbi:peptide methionine sulfoxide reductase [Arenibacter sp. TNZ]|jgi:peptide-methionine (S)-S-oxide reductase|uniref:peptide-methionine (S)-S-oxide reductase n=1 Tax=Arenibacter TaxID=178469 RepID=UPI000CD3BEB4|nr:MULTISPECIES: peptide-methionine (S)-S-oxide reductase [Arenibacter]MCM4174208.1 peptide methionine sulfoxide reductase [Arenibacter sp. TNZ]